MDGGEREGGAKGPARAAAKTGATATRASSAVFAATARKAVPVRLGPLLCELAELKRVRCRGWPGRSLADAAFRRAIADLSEGAEPDRVALAHLALAAAHTRLGAVDETALAASAVPAEERRLVYRRAAADALTTLGEEDAAALDALSSRPGPPAKPLPPAALLLARTRWHEPLAGEPIDPTEGAIRFGEHAFCVAVMGAAIARARAEPPGPPFLLGLLHHAPDVGVAAERDCRLPPAIADAARNHLAARSDLSSPPGLVFNAADGIDAVGERRAAANRAGLSLSDAVPADEIAPPGPMRAFHVAVVRSLGLAY